jgi:hypothetical protein
VRLDPQALDALAIAGVVLGALALLVGIAAHLRIRRLRRDYSLLQGDGEHGAFVDVVARKTEEVAALRSDLARQSQTLVRIQDDLADAIRHVAVIRYDAFADLGGRYSFSLALLDDAGDGLVLTSIHGRSETRTYFKGVRGGSSDDPLSPEEIRAIAYAQGKEDA